MGAGNPMRHKCKLDGCYLETTHCPLELFAGSFGGKIAASDIDFVVERKGQFIFMEWKTAPAVPTDGQKRMLRALAKEANKRVIVVTSPVPTRRVNLETVLRLQIVESNGTFRDNVDVTVAYLYEKFQDWFSRVNG